MRLQSKKLKITLVVLTLLALPIGTSFLTYKIMYEEHLDSLKSEKQLNSTSNIQKYSGLTIQKALRLCNEYIGLASGLNMKNARMDSRSTRISEKEAMIHGNVTYNGELSMYSCTINNDYEVISAAVETDSMISKRISQSISEYAFD